MPTIQPYEQQVAPQGFITSQASPNDVNTGAGFVAVGQGLDAAAKDVNYVDQDQGRLWAANQISGFRKNTIDQLENLKTTANPADPNYASTADNFIQSFDQQANAALEAAPSRSARRYMAQHIATLRDQAYLQARTFTAQLAGEYSKTNYQTSINNNIDAISKNASNDNVQSIVAADSDAIDGLAGLNALDKLKLKTSAQLSYARQQVFTTLQANAPGFLQSLGLSGGVTTPRGVKGGVATQAPTDPTALTDSLWNAQINQESGGKQFGPNGQPLTSSAGATGVAQVMPGTGPTAAKLAGLPWDENRFRTDANYNLALGKAYMQDQLKTFGGDTAKALAAYNMGPGSASNGTGVAGLVAKYGDQWLAHAPAETQNYVHSIMAKASPAPVASQIVANAPDSYVEPANEGTIAASNSPLWGWSKLSPAEKITAVRQAEALVSKGNADARANLQRTITDVETSLLQGNNPQQLQDPQLSRDNLTRVLGPDVGTRAADAMDYNRRVGQFNSQLSTMPTAQATATLQQLQPSSSDANEYAHNFPLYKAAVDAFAKVAKYREDNPSEWAVANSIGGAKPLQADPSTWAAEMKNRQAARSQMATSYGVQMPLVSKDEGESMLKTLTRMAPADAANTLAGLRQSFSTDALGTGAYRSVMEQIAPKSPMVAYAGNLAAMPTPVNVGGQQMDGKQVGAMVLEGQLISNGKSLADPTGTGKPMIFDDKTFRTLFQSSVGSAFRNLDGPTGQRAMDEVYQAAHNYLVADAAHQGMSFETASGNQGMVERAIQAVTGGGVARVNNSQLLIPWGTDPQKFQNEFPVRAQAVLDKAGLKPDAGFVLKNYEFDNIGDGKYAFRAGNRYAFDPNTKRPLVVDFGQPAPTAPKPAAPTPAPSLADIRPGMGG